MDKTSTLVDENNKLYATINTYNNTMGAALNQLLTAYGLTEPLTPEQLQRLTLKQQAGIVHNIADPLKAIGAEISGRNLEANLLAAGWPTIQAAINDVPNYFTGEAAARLTITLTKAKETLDLLDSLIDADIAFSLLSKVIDMKNKVAETAGVINTV